MSLASRAPRAGATPRVESRRRTLTLLAILIAHAAMLPAASLAVPFLPDSDAEVLERLPWTANDAAETLARVRRAQLARDPRNLALALDAARADIAHARAAGDPRYLGYAQAALAPWDAPQPPAAVQVLRATIRHPNTNPTSPATPTTIIVANPGKPGVRRSDGVITVHRPP